MSTLRANVWTASVWSDPGSPDRHHTISTSPISCSHHDGIISCGCVRLEAVAGGYQRPCVWTVLPHVTLTATLWHLDAGAEAVHLITPTLAKPNPKSDSFYPIGPLAPEPAKPIDITRRRGSRTRDVSYHRRRWFSTDPPIQCSTSRSARDGS